MGFFKRFRKKEENVGNNLPASKEGGALNGRPEGSSEVGAKSEAMKAGAAQADKPSVGAAMPQVKEVSVEEVKARIDAGTAPVLIDVREPWEHQIANIAQATLIPMNSIPARMDELDRNAETVVYCHHGTRSLNVATYLAQHGFGNVKNLTGGIDAWARRVDLNMRTY